MKWFRKTIFWLHLVVGLVVGLGVAFMAGTGLLMAYEKPIVERAERYDGRAPKADMKAQSIENLIAGAIEDNPDASPTAITAFADLDRPAAVQLGRERVSYVNNYTGLPVGSEAAGLRGFFHTVEELHRWLAASGDWRNWGRNTTGVVNLGFLVLVVSGLWLWMPRKLKWNSFKPVLVPRLRGNGKLRDWNWHNVVGFWMLIPLTVIVLTGTIVSYPWATALLYRAVGDTPPPPRNEGGRPQQANGQAGGPGRDGRPGGQGGGGEGRRGGGGGGERREINLDGLNDLWAKTEDASPGWQSISLRLGGGRRGGGEGGGENRPAGGDAMAENGNRPGGGQRNGGSGGGSGGGGGNGGGENANREAAGGVQFVVNYGNSTSPLSRVTLTYDRRTGELIKPADATIGRYARSLVVPIHRGEIFGLTGMTIAAGACISALVLVYTGFALSYRRLVRPVLAKVRNRRASAAVSVRQPEPAGV